jgi:hypothetical protein
MTDKAKTSKLAHAYHGMLTNLKDFIDGAEDAYLPRIHYAIDAAKEKATELGEITREEAEHVAGYLKRDLQDAATYLDNEGKELSDWFKFDVELVEDRLLNLMSHAINTTALELDQLSKTAAQENIWYMGEVTGPGTFVCDKCQHEIRFYHVQDIPACPQCGEGVFHRISAE